MLQRQRSTAHLNRLGNYQGVVRERLNITSESENYVCYRGHVRSCEATARLILHQSSSLTRLTSLTSGLQMKNNVHLALLSSSHYFLTSSSLH